jgi:16S rRNA (uracil1498-N3)-methyltransferase
MRRFFVSLLPNAQEPRCLLNEQESHHLFRVVKISQGEEIELFDGSGSTCVAILVHTKDRQAQVQWIRDLHAEIDEQELWIFLCILKQQAWSTSLRMATELGVHHIVPVLSQRSVARKEKRTRWESIVLAAVKQSGRSVIPTLHPMISFADMCEEKTMINRLLLVPDSPSFSSSSSVGDTALCIGPEGGLSQKEIQKATQKGWVARGLGKTILRADTATVSALSLLLFSRASSVSEQRQEQ